MKFVTYNLANYNDHPFWEQRVKMIAAELITQDADLIGMQEVRFDPDQPDTAKTYQNMAEMVLREIQNSDKGKAAYKGARLVTEPAMYYDSKGEAQWQYPLPSALGTRQFWEGASILSRADIPVTGNRLLDFHPDGGDGNRRATQYAQAVGDTGALHVFNAHLSYDQAQFEQNIEETIEYMNQFSGPALLMGDLNAEPRDPALQQLRDAGFVDLWAFLYPDDPGYTESHPAGENKRIDYFWGNDEIKARAKSIELFGGKPSPNEAKPGSDEVYASDHLGLCLTLG